MIRAIFFMVNEINFTGFYSYVYVMCINTKKNNIDSLWDFVPFTICDVNHNHKKLWTLLKLWLVEQSN